MTSPNMTRAIRIQQVSMATKEIARIRNWGRARAAYAGHRYVQRTKAHKYTLSTCGTSWRVPLPILRLFSNLCSSYFGNVVDTVQSHSRSPGYFEGGGRLESAAHEGKVQGYIQVEFHERQLKIHENSNPIPGGSVVFVERTSLEFPTPVYTAAHRTIYARHRAHPCTHTHTHRTAPLAAASSSHRCWFQWLQRTVNMVREP